MFKKSLGKIRIKACYLKRFDHIPKNIFIAELPEPVKSKHKNKLAVSSRQNLEVYDVLGNEVVKLVDEYKPAGVYEVNFDPESSNLYPASSIRELASGIGYASGVYFYQLRIGNQLQTKKMILLR
jgi:hypothetical protein